MGRPLISEMRWFVSDLSYSDAPCTVLAGTAFANRLVGVFETPEEAQALVASHNNIFKAKGPAEGATSPSHGPNNPHQEKAMDARSDTTAKANTAIDPWFARACELETALIHIQSIAAAAFTIMIEGSQGTAANPDVFKIPRRTFNEASAFMRAIDDISARAVENQ